MALVVMKLIAAHFVAWGVMQRRNWLPGEDYRFWREYVGSVLYAAIAALLLALGSEGVGFVGVVWLIATTTGCRLVLDTIRGRRLRRSWSNLIVVQSVEVLLICALTALGADSGEFPVAASRVLNSPATYGLVAAYAASLWLGGTIVRLVTGLLWQNAEEQRPGIDGAGSIIGVLERLLVTSFVLFWPAYGAAAVGFIFSAKSIARFPEMGKENGTRFAEYYLVGTLTSFAVAIGAGMIARMYLLR